MKTADFSLAPRTFSISITGALIAVMMSGCGGGQSRAAPRSPQAQQAAAPSGGPSADASQQEPSYACAVTVPSNTSDAQLPALARISAQAAGSAATASVAGTVAATSSDNENGGLLSSVEIKGNGELYRDVKVDAGAGNVLLVGSASATMIAENEGAGETAEGAEHDIEH